MISSKTLNSIEYYKIMQNVSSYAVLDKTKFLLCNYIPKTKLSEAQFELNNTRESFDLLYKYNVSNIYYFDNIEDEINRVRIGGVLNNAELLKVAGNLKSARILKSSILSVNDETIKFIPSICENIYSDKNFEEELYRIIISEEEISDNASPKLYQIRKEILSLNAKIKDKLNSYIRGQYSKYLQENVITLREDRYVIPVKSEYRSSIKGFIHDQSSSGSTVFIEPEQVMELNNNLKIAQINEENEIRKILYELSVKVENISKYLTINADIMSDIDMYFARAIYSFKNKCSIPNLNDKGLMTIIEGRHPLIDKDKVVPVSVSFGDGYNILLISGPNTGGKTVTLKLCGLFSLMAMSGLYIPASDDCSISVFDNIFCDVGDEQSIESSLSTFSSHFKNIIEVVNLANNKSLVLLDELGAGTDPEEGSALALAVIENLLEKNCVGIITTHYSKLKEFAVVNSKIENACMEFDPVKLTPLYKLNIGIPGSSNAIEIAKNLGLDISIINKSYSYLSSDKVNFENIIKKAENSRREYDAIKEKLVLDDKIKNDEINLLKSEKDKLIIEKEKIANSAKQQIKSIVSDKLSEAEEIIDELKKLLKQAGLESKEIFRANELKNRIKNSKYLYLEDKELPINYKKIPKNDIKVGLKVFVKSLNGIAEILSFKNDLREIEVLFSNAKIIVKYDDVFSCSDIFEDDKNSKKINDNVKVFKGKINNLPVQEINVIGKTSLEALTEIDYFIKQAISDELEEVKIIHGVGQGILQKEIRNYLKKLKCVSSYRGGRYGEGENGVTIVSLKKI